MPLIKELCQNCFCDLNKAVSQSNFCSQECFDEWILKQQAASLRHAERILFGDTRQILFAGETRSK